LSKVADSVADPPSKEPRAAEKLNEPDPGFPGPLIAETESVTAVPSAFASVGEAVSESDGSSPSEVDLSSPEEQASQDKGRAMSTSITATQRAVGEDIRGYMKSSLPTLSERGNARKQVGNINAHDASPTF